MFTFIVFLLFLSLFNATRANFDDPPSRYIFLALGVSKAAYGSIPPRGRTWKNQFIRDSKGRKVCDGNVWDVQGTGVTRDSEVILFIDSDRKFAVFGFRGTEVLNPVDWSRNFKIKLIPVLNRYRLHKGFSEHFSNIRVWFEGRYRRLSSENYRIVLTGHSLGGALATIAASHVTRFRPPFAVITFASPRVGNEAFSRYYQQHVGCHRTIRFVVQNDIIANLPLRFTGYRHVCAAKTIMDQNARFDYVKHHSIKDGYDKALRKTYQGRRMRDVSNVCRNRK